MTPTKLNITTEEVVVSTDTLASNEYKITATAIFDCHPSDVMKLLWDWEQLLAVGLPGMTSNFRWIKGGPDEVPSKFHFDMAGTVIKEEIYERVEVDGFYRLRYKALEAALGILEYDAILDWHETDENQTAFQAIRTIVMAVGSGPEMLAEMCGSETQYLKDYFARHSNSV